MADDDGTLFADHPHSRRLDRAARPAPAAQHRHPRRRGDRRSGPASHDRPDARPDHLDHRIGRARRVRRHPVDRHRRDGAGRNRVGPQRRLGSRDRVRERPRREPRGAHSGDRSAHRREPERHVVVAEMATPNRRRATRPPCGSDRNLAHARDRSWTGPVRARHRRPRPRHWTSCSPACAPTASAASARPACSATPTARRAPKANGSSATSSTTSCSRSSSGDRSIRRRTQPPTPSSQPRRRRTDSRRRLDAHRRLTMRFRTDGTWNRIGTGGRVVLAGSPLRVFRLTAAGADHCVARSSRATMSHRPRSSTASSTRAPSTRNRPPPTTHRHVATSPSSRPNSAGPPAPTATSPSTTAPSHRSTERRFDSTGTVARAQHATPDGHSHRRRSLAFVDADVSLPDHELARTDCSPTSTDPRVGLVAPRVVGDPTASLDLGTEPARVRAGSRVSYVPAAAIVIRAAAFDDIGGFDEASPLRGGRRPGLATRPGGMAMPLRAGCQRAPRTSTRLGRRGSDSRSATARRRHRSRSGTRGCCHRCD